jgi:hypothetical protein
LILILLLFIDTEFPLWTVSNGSDRLSQSLILVDGILVSQNTSTFNVKISDIAILVLFVMLFFSMSLKKWVVFRLYIDYTLYKYIILFFILSLIYLTNNDALTDLQFLVSVVYLFKFMEVSLIYAFFHYYLYAGFKIVDIYKVLIMATLLSAIFGIVNLFTGYFSGWLIEDRMSFYGVQAFTVFIIIAGSLSKKPIKATFGLSKYIVYLTLLVSILSIYLCGKRSLFLALLLGVLYLYSYNVNISKRMIRLVTSVIVIGLMFYIWSEVFTSSYIAIDGMNARYFKVLDGSMFSKIPGLDYSSMERIGKILTGLNLVYLNFFTIPAGFWSAHFTYGFIPDSALQLILEIGFAGLMLLFFPLIIIYRRSKTIRCDEMFVYRAWIASFIFILVLSIFSNPVYIFKLVGVFLLLTALLNYSTLGKRL